MTKLPPAGFDRQYQTHLKHLKLKGLQPKTIEAYSRAIRRLGAHFDHRIHHLTEAPLIGYRRRTREDRRSRLPCGVPSDRVSETLTGERRASAPMSRETRAPGIGGRRRHISRTCPLSARHRRHGRLNAANFAPASTNPARSQSNSKKIFATRRPSRRARAGLVQQTDQVAASRDLSLVVMRRRD